jgi:hypothetical protein
MPFIYPFGSRVINWFVSMKAVTRYEETDGILHNLWDLRVHYHAHIPPPIPILSQINPFHVIPSYFFTIHCNIFTVVSVLPPSLSNPCTVKPA